MQAAAAACILAAPGGGQDVALRESRLEGFFTIRLDEDNALTDAIGAPWMKDPVPVKRVGKILRLDLDRDGRFARTVSPGRLHVIEMLDGGRKKPIMLEQIDGTWRVASARIWKGRIGRSRIAIHDVDANDAVDEGIDRLRIDDGVFMRWSRRHKYTFTEGVGFLAFGLTKRGRLPTTRNLDRKPQNVSDLQWEAFCAVNSVRNEIGMPALRLDQKRSAACMLHARYLQMNKFDMEDRKGIDPHDEDEKRRGYTPSGHEASKWAAVGTTRDVRRTVREELATLSLRARLLTPAGRPFGVGLVTATAAATSKAYSVIWMDGPNTDLGDPHFVPAPGAGKVPLEFVRSFPLVENPEDFHDSPHGFPISVTARPWPYRNVRMSLVKHGKRGRKSDVPGFVYTHDNLFTPIDPHNADSAFFVPKEPLDPKTTYTATFHATRRGAHTSSTWSFRTGVKTKPLPLATRPKKKGCHVPWVGARPPVVLESIRD